MLSGEHFVQEGLITKDQLSKALQKQLEAGGSKPIARYLVELGMITENQRVKCLGKSWGIPYIDVTQHTPTEQAMEQISVAFARRFKVLPYKIEDKKLHVAMINPLDVFVIDTMREQTKLEIEPMVAVDPDIGYAIEEHYRAEEEMSEALEGVISDFEGDMEVIDSEGDDELSEAELRELGEDAPIIRLANLIINTAIAEKASDIHMEPLKDGLIVRLRVDGVMFESMTLPKKVTGPLTSRFKIVANMDIAEKRVPQDSRISARINGKDYDFRVSTLPVVYGEKIVMRVLDRAGISVGLAKLGFREKNLQTLEDMAKKSFGIVLVTGPTGSGKSTTLYSLLNQANDGMTNMTTIEDPVEYELSGINQCNVNERAGMTFEAGLRALLRQDPDVIMVGEMRDKETATIAMEAALTGHLVFSTLHTNDAPSAPTRLNDMGVEPFLVASSIVGILAQRLMRTICPNCKEEYEEEREALTRLGFKVPDGTPEKITLHKGKGCENCKETGYKGRTGVHELLVVTNEVRDAILNQEPAHVLKNLAEEQGMEALQVDAVAKILDGITTVEEALRVIYA
jgi:type IV pilus assembly protein PilB